MLLTGAPWLMPHCRAADEPRPPKGAVEAANDGLAALAARGTAWTSAFKAGHLPPAFAASLSTPGTRLAAARLAAVTDDAATAARLDLGAWNAPVTEELADARAAAEAAVSAADVLARAAAAVEAADLGTQAQIIRFERSDTDRCTNRVFY